MIKKNLLLLGIQYKLQLEENDIHFWWKKKYTEILKSNLENKNELLISLNNALEDLEKIDISLINKELKTENKGKQTTQSENNNKQNNNEREKSQKEISEDIAERFNQAGCPPSRARCKLPLLSVFKK